ncbi:MAG: response regulator [Gammaproteobacteria bacterium]
MDMSKSSPRSILVIDDNQEMAEFIRLAIEELGHIVIERHTGKSGLQAFHDAANSIDLILLDIAIPDINGIHVLEEIRSVSADVPVILVSGFVQSKAEARALGANDVLAKPFNMQNLEDLIKKVLV